MLSAFAALCLALAFAALDLFTFLDAQCGAGTSTTTSAEAALLNSAAAIEALPPFAAVVVLFLTVALIYHHVMLMGRRFVAVPVAGAVGNRRRSISRLLMFVLCVSVGTLEFIVFGQAAAGGGGGAGHGAQARALGLAARRALPAAATAAFFLGMMLIIVAHVRAGGEGGGTGAVAGDGPIQGLLLRVLTKVAAGMAAALVGLIAMAVNLYDAKLRLGSCQLSLKSILWEDCMQVAIKAEAYVVIRCILSISSVRRCPEIRYDAIFVVAIVPNMILWSVDNSDG